MSADAILLHAADDVVTALRPIAAGESVRIAQPDGGTHLLRAAEPIPLCHKLALHDIAADAVVRKYGEPIGRARAPIAAGRHVHVHSLRSDRARTVAPEGTEHA